MKKVLLVILLVLALIAATLVLFYICNKPDNAAEVAVEEVASQNNPLTGETPEEGFDVSALDRRITAFVVENTSDARPQWGMTDENYPPDIMLEGEVEGGITRTLWFYADYNKLPEIIGPMRSARPPYIRFSELFDSVFIHWGQSGSKGKYVGATTVFRKDKVDHINQMQFHDTMGLYGRNQTRPVNVEHRGILYGDKVPAALEQEGFRVEPNDYTKLKFSPLGQLSAVIPAKSIHVKYSDRTDGFNTDWTYDKKDKMYHTKDFDNDFARDNLIVLYDDTAYIDKEDYGGHGYTLTYCDYLFTGGKGLLLSRGMAKEIEWRREDGKLVLVDTYATKLARETAAAKLAEVQDEKSGFLDKFFDKIFGREQQTAPRDPATIEVTLSLNKGKTWIGWISNNNGGSATIK